MMLPGIFLNYRLKATPSFMASFSRQTKGYRYIYVYIYIFYKVKYIHILYMYIYISGSKGKRRGSCKPKQSSHYPK